MSRIANDLVSTKDYCLNGKTTLPLWRMKNDFETTCRQKLINRINRSSSHLFVCYIRHTICLNLVNVTVTVFSHHYQVYISEDEA